MKKLEGAVAVVTGATRGAGRGIARALGGAGATVIVTGRSTREAGATEGLPGTVEEAAEDVTSRGGRGVGVRCDHADDAEVTALFERVRRDHGRLDLLVNNAWGGYEQYDPAEFKLPFWEQPTAKRWHGMFVAGVRAQLLASQRAAPILIAQRRGLIVSTIFWDEGKYLGNLFYDVAKAAIARMVSGMARELRPHGVAAVALSCGFMRTERVLAANLPDYSGTESPEYDGRAVAALAAEPRILERTGEVLYTGQLARDYGFVDVDGSQPPVFRLPD
jgi:NAD(P)-dependent dehydrogenase (short-subunit alcohol dehydrogenase family)